MQPLSDVMAGASPLISRVPDKSNALARLAVQGKFLFAGSKKVFVKGVTYGTFRPGADGTDYGDPRTVAEDFSRIAENGMNAIRTYTVPPLWLLDAAQEHGLRVMVGLPWEQHITFLDGARRRRSIEERIRSYVKSCERHPAILCFSIGNEIPSQVVRWYGRKRIERFLSRLYQAVKAEDPDALVTYVNYPSTEYLQLPFLDLVAFNVFLESKPELDRYLGRLHNIAGDRPLLLTELGLDSRRNGEPTQARALEWQIRSAFASGGAGAFLFAWTDEWHRGGFDITDWDFGLTTRDRKPKEALRVVRNAFTDIPKLLNGWAPRITVVVCVHNGESTIRETLARLEKIDYHNHDVLVIDDGSTDATFRIASQFPFRVVHTEQRGLASARNTGMELSTGDIIAYLDADAYPDEHWLSHLALTFSCGRYAAVGGPNIPPDEASLIARCVAAAPGGPIHVLLSDTEAEHIPGCNMAFLKSQLKAIGGFDPRFRTAGDDVDVCWKLLQKGLNIGFSPGAVVWHHRRDSVADYWKQQVGYGKAEGMLEKKWPEKYNSLGHVSWKGRLYGTGHTLALPLRRSKIYHGKWGTGLFQSIYAKPMGRWQSLLLMPEWYYVVWALSGLSVLSYFWEPLFVAIPMLLVAVSAQFAQSVYTAAMSRPQLGGTSRGERAIAFALTVFLHLVQPLARLVGRLKLGLTPWRRRRACSYVFPRPQRFVRWQEEWRAPELIVQDLSAHLRGAGSNVLSGGDFDRWDLEVRVGSTGAVRLRALVEEHGGGRQLIRFFSWPICSVNRFVTSASAILLGILAGYSHAWVASAVLGGFGVWIAALAFLDCAAAACVINRHFK